MPNSKTRTYRNGHIDVTTSYDGIPLTLVLKDHSGDNKKSGSPLDALAISLRQQFMLILRAYNKGLKTGEQPNEDALKHNLSQAILAARENAKLESVTLSFIAGFNKGEAEKLVGEEAQTLGFLAYSSSQLQIQAGETIVVQESDLNNITDSTTGSVLFDNIQSLKSSSYQSTLSIVSTDQGPISTLTVPTAAELAKAKPLPLSTKTAIASCVAGGLVAGGASVFPIWGAISAASLATAAKVGAAAAFVGFMAVSWPIFAAIGGALVVGGGIYLLAKHTNLFSACIGERAPAALYGGPESEDYQHLDDGGDFGGAGGSGRKDAEEATGLFGEHLSRTGTPVGHGGDGEPSASLFHETNTVADRMLGTPGSDESPDHGMLAAGSVM